MTSTSHATFDVHAESLPGRHMVTEASRYVNIVPDTQLISE